MREWNLKSGDPLSLTLAADVRLGPTDYNDDQVWELSLGGGEPPALALYTTYGLRARALRMFPRFTENDLTLTDPADFANPPAIRHIYPNFLALTYSPFPDIDVVAEYWVPESQAIGGRMQVTNRSKVDRQIRLEWVGQLTPTEGQRMAPLEIQAAPVLSGSTDGLSPVIFLTGGPLAGTGSYPSLTLGMDLQPGSSRRLSWAHAALPDASESFTLARKVAARRIDAESARLELLNAGQIDIYTGNPDWDSAFALSQKLAFGLFVGPTAHLPHPSFVFTRQPDQGYSMRGDGTDYSHLWNGQTPLEAYYLSSLILPAAPHLAEGLVRNFLSTQSEDGFIDWKPGLGGQRSRLLATPLLATLAWRIYEASENQEFLEDIFTGLMEFNQAWFTPQHDRDGDGIPEWDHPMQSGSEDHPIYSRWHEWSEGVEINTAESPALCAFLYQECEALRRIAGQIGKVEQGEALKARAERLRTVLETGWDQAGASYHDWDRDTHLCTHSVWLGERQGPGEIIIHQAFEHPVRFLVRIQTNGETTRRPQIFIHGSGISGQHRIERISDDRIKWYLGIGSMTGEYVYTSLEYIEVKGVDPNDLVSLSCAGYYGQDQTLLLPLWAGIPDARRARRLIKRTITNPKKYWHPYGMPTCLCPPETSEEVVYQSVNLPWNSLIGEGLLRYGFRNEAAELVSRLMAGIVKTLKQEGAFRRYYHADSGQGIGERNALHGLAPLGLFLETLGVRLISSRRVALSGFNPFPWPVTVKYRGMTILCQKEKTMVIFPDGQTSVFSEPHPQIVSLEFEPD